MKLDFHFHSTFSDGSETIEHIFRMAHEAGIKAVALTDHDTVLGIPAEFEASKRYEIPFVPAAEFTAKEDGIKFHVLGYGIDYTSAELISYSQELLDYMNERSRRQIKVAQQNGILISEDEFFQESRGGPLYRAKFLKVLAKHGYIKHEDIMSLLSAYFDKGAVYYAEDNFHYRSFSEICDIIKRNRGVVVLAHPQKIKRKSEELYRKLIHSPLLDGLEVYHPANSEEVAEELLNITRDRNLIFTGGTDYHGLYMKHPIPLGSQTVPDRVCNFLKDYLIT